jgi:glucose/arabinose dehydrogenase
MKWARRWRVLLCGVVAAPLLLACGGGQSPVAAAPTPAAAKEERAAEAKATATATAPPAGEASAGGSAPTAASAPAPTAAPAPPPTAPPIAPVAAAAPSAPKPATRAQAVDPSSVRLALEPLPAELDRPVHLTHAGDGSGRLFVVEKGGRIRVLRDGVALPTSFLDITPLVRSSGSEQGLLGLAFHPRYAENGRFFIAYTAGSGDQVVEAYRVSGDPNVADPGSGRTLLRMEDPAPNHNGGLVLFGPDGYLWIGTGDGGGAGDRYGNGQNRGTLLGKMLRLDVDNGDPYAIPPDNPFVNEPDTRPEIWAIGLRNPWRYSFDRATGDLYIADVGQNAWEEVNLQRAGSRGGENYGWPRMEGRHCFPANASCDPTPFVLPVGEYGRDGGISITGGHVYRGSESPRLVGLYLFGDFGSGRIWSLDEPTPGGWRMVELLRSPLRISSFGEDEAGELYAASFHDNRVYRITAP